MKPTDENFYTILAEILLDNPISETPEIHVARQKMDKGAVQKQLENIILDYKNAALDIDLTPYEEALACLRKIRTSNGDYAQLLEEIVQAYAPPKVKMPEKNVHVNPVVLRPSKNKGQ